MARQPLNQWERIVPKSPKSPYHNNNETPFSEMLLPTFDTARFDCLLQQPLALNRSVLDTGSPGVGKVSALTF